MLGSRLMVQAAKAQPPAQATRPSHTLKGRALPAGAPLNTVSGGATIGAVIVLLIWGAIAGRQGRTLSCIGLF
jgi:hypothetical protein